MRNLSPARKAVMLRRATTILNSYSFKNNVKLQYYNEIIALILRVYQLIVPSHAFKSAKYFATEQYTLLNNVFLIFNTNCLSGKLNKECGILLYIICVLYTLSHKRFNHSLKTKTLGEGVISLSQFLIYSVFCVR